MSCATRDEIGGVGAPPPKKMSDAEWVKLHAGRFTEVRSHYESYERFLKDALKMASRTLAPLAIVEARAKGIESFAEKCLRKRDLYEDPADPQPPDPLVRMTDLCGGRVITQTLDHMSAICEFVKRAFDIDEANSEDVSLRLHPAEFGYRSVHYIVMVNPDKLRSAGITLDIPPELIAPERLKAEVQVRTLLEHAWADIGHDLTYKPEVKVPDHIQREFARIAAVLEGADRDFSRIVRGLGEIRSNYGAYHTRKDVEREIGIHRVILEANPESIGQAVKLAQLELSLGNHGSAIKTLDPYRERGHQGVERLRGVALTEMHWDAPTSPEYREGHGCLEAACAHSRKDAETLCLLAESWAHQKEYGKARARFNEAVAVDATEPLSLSRHLEFEVNRHSDYLLVQVASPRIRSSMERCRAQIAAQENAPWAWSSLAVFHLLLNERFEALGAVAKLISLCETPPDTPGSAPGECSTNGRLCAAGRALLRLLETLKNMESIKDHVGAYTWCERAVLLGLAVRLNDADAVAAVRRHASWGAGKPHLSPGERIVILSGACAPDLQEAVDAFKLYVETASKNLSLTLLCGGTTSGISGLAGEIARQSKGSIRAFGYLPSSLPLGVREDTEGYLARFDAPGGDFTPLDPMRGWTDIVAAGVDPSRVKLLSFGGGEISRAECALGLALGARVGVVVFARNWKFWRLMKERQFDDRTWESHGNLARLPLDAMTLRAFFLVDELPCRKDEFEKAAKRTHEEYLKSAIPKEPSLQPWETLDGDLKLSNFHQVAYAEYILKTKGLGIRRLTDPAAEPLNMRAAIGEKAIRELAEMEHGRWNVERLLLGWRYSETKDVTKKLSPFLIPWEKVPPHIQQYDIDAICEMPKKLREVDLEVYKL